MESGERPSKLRKLSHGSSTAVPGFVDEGTLVSKHASEPSTILSASMTVSDTAEQNSSNVAIQDSEQHTNTLAESNADDGTATAPTGALSKNRLKKLRKQQEWDAGKDWRKARRREKTKERKQRQRERRDQGAEQQNGSGQPSTKSRSQRPRLLPVTFVIDCGFDDKMTDKERISLGSQITRSYSDNSHALFRAHLMVSSWGGLLKERFDTILDKQWLNWKDIQFTEHDFVVAAAKAKELMNHPRGGRLESVFQKYAPHPQHSSSSSSDAKQDESVPDPSLNEPSAGPPEHTDDTEQDQNGDTDLPPSESDQGPLVNDPNLPTPLPEPQVIYLTSDSPHTLTTLDPYSTYIIGGLVDKNRHKGICYRTAVERGVKTAKLPIGQYMDMNSRFVLATNHVIEIMVRYLECGDWGEAFMKVVPRRKGGKLKGENEQVEKSHSADGDTGNEDDDDHDDNEDDASEGEGVNSDDNE